MNTFKRLLPIAAVVLTLVNSCKNDGCNDPLAFNYDPDGESAESCIYEPTQVQLIVQPKFGELDFVLGDTLDINDGRQLIISYYGVYLSDLSFKEKAEDDYLQWSNNNVALIKDGETSANGVYLNKSVIEGFRFDIGVDTANYNDDPTDTTVVPSTSPLAPQNPTMYWGWAGGYRFISLQGVVDTSSAKDGSKMTAFQYHCGLPANLKTMTFDSASFVQNSNRMDVGLTLDIRKLFEGVDFETAPADIHDGNHPVTIKIMQNALNAIELQ